MASKTKKTAYYIGAWKDDVVTDDVIRQVANHSNTEVGQKVKLRLSLEGLHISKSSMFQGSTKLDSVPLQSIYFLTVNQHTPNCLLCIIKDPHRKYNIVAFRCVTPIDAGEFVKTFKILKGDTFKMTRKGDGNWTLRASSSQRPMIEITVPEKPVTIPRSNGDIGGHPHLDEALNPESIATVEQPVVKGKHLQNIGVQTYVRDDDDNMSQISDASSVKEELGFLSQQLREVKYLLEKSTGISAEEHIRRAKVLNDKTVHNHNNILNNNSHANNLNLKNNNNDHVIKHLPDGSAKVFVSSETPSTIYSGRGGFVHADVPDYRSFGVQTAPKSRRTAQHPPTKYSTKAVAASLRQNGTHDKMNNHTRLQNNLTMHPNPEEIRTVVNGRVVSVPATRQHSITQSNTHENGQQGDISNGLKIKFNRPPEIGQRSRSLRLKSGSFSVPSTVQRPIEHAYSARGRESLTFGQPVIVRKGRPKSMYMVGGKPLEVHNPSQRPVMVTRNFEAPV